MLPITTDHQNIDVITLGQSIYVFCKSAPDSLQTTPLQPPELHSHHQRNGGILPSPPAQHSHRRFTHITNTHIPCESAPSFQTHHRQLYCNHRSYTATTVQHSHHWEHSHHCWHSTATSDLCTNTFLANTFLTSIHAHNAWQIILLSTQPLPAYHSNCRQHSHWCQSNAATSTGAAQPPLVTCTYLFEQHLHGLHLCLQHFSNSHHCNASTSGATQPPPELPVLHSHHWCYAVTTGVAQPPLVIPILSFLLLL
jgi:hypothetical protein